MRRYYTRFMVFGFYAATVRMPVTRHPPCSPGRAVFPHPVPRLHAHPRRVKPCMLWPAGRLAPTDPVRHVRAACPFRAACFRRDLPRVVGFPHLRVLCSIRLPSRIRWAVPVTGLFLLPGRVPRRCAGSSMVPCPGFPCRASGAVDHRPTFPTAGTSGASHVLRRLSSCMPRPEDSGGPAPPCQDGGARLACGSVKTLGVRDCHVEAVPALQGTRLPLMSAKRFCFDWRGFWASSRRSQRPWLSACSRSCCATPAAAPQWAVNSRTSASEGRRPLR